ncbi:uncharacterized protein I303_107585 [Kwoniella dejecticola CBS 10117]|uniref:DUF1279 domain-containing protein n=1 Tax=Kwoniella dejecticola CBS 10117 TaxID=1296121 RepID=A0A1A5ZV51_9TREE|nr:uncharacterized protein I303_07595 [Kwoniella dejecticola CBS 10117]OBR81685.1 hypothetical protein I303_07595 [Kwoniella dejecticola CBS 10117]
MATIPLLRSTIASSSRDTMLRSTIPSKSALSPRIPLSRSTTLPLTTLRLSRRTIHPHTVSTNFPLRSFTSTSLRRATPAQTSTSSTSSTSSNSSDSNQSEELPEHDPKLSVTQRLKILFKKYGWYALGIYTFLSTIDCSLTFLAVHALGAERIKPLFDGVIHFYRVRRYGDEEAENLRIEDENQRIKELEEANSNAKEEKAQWFSKTFWAELALAYAIHKTLLLPVRAGFTVAWTPKIVNWLASRGWVGKGGLTRAATHAQGKVKNASDRVKDRVKKQ